MKVTMAHLSDRGRVRARNEDAVLCAPDPETRRGHLLVVADGMGGAEAGEVASRMAVTTVAEVYFASEAGPAGPTEALVAAVVEANRRIFAASKEPGKKGMGTTCTAVAIADGGVAVAHVGDSRAYRLRRKHLERLTRVHSVWAEQVAHGRTSPANRAGQNVLTRALGVDGRIEAEARDGLVAEGGDRFLLCSDGLWGLVTDPEIAWALLNKEAEAACQYLVGLANERGGPDNVTVAMAEIGA